MNPLATLMLRVSPGAIERLVRELSDTSVDMAQVRLGASLQTLNRSAARGYIRARSRRVVNAQVRRHFANQTLPASLAIEVTSKVLDRVTEQLLRRWMQQPAVAVVRRAA